MLTDRRVALAETRELDTLADMLERAGAEIIRCPLIAIRDAPDPTPVEAWIRRMIAGHHDDVILYTGEGLRRLLGFAERAAIRDEFIAALGRVRKITRGPKPRRALREIGLSTDLRAVRPTTEGIIATLESAPLTGRTIGVQLYGQEPNTRLDAFLTAGGARIDTVAPYIYASAADDAQVAALVRDMADGRIDVIALTSSPQVRRLADVASKTDLSQALQTGFDRTKVAAIGPVVVEELTRRGLRVDATADAPYAMKPLLKAMSDLFEGEAGRSA